MSNSSDEESIWHGVCRDPAYWPAVRPGSWTCTHETFAAHPRHPGWRYEYKAGKAEIWPNFFALRTRLRTGTLAFTPTHWAVETAAQASHTGLMRLFRLAFGSTSDLLGKPAREVKQLARDNIAAWRAGGLTRESAVVPLKAGSTALAGALLLQWKRLTSTSDAVRSTAHGFTRVPQIGLIMVHPAMEGYGVARALLHHVMEAMQRCGHTMVESAYRLVNDRARRWYQRQGFTEVPSRLTARLLLSGASSLEASASSDGERAERKREYDVLEELARHR